MLHMHRGCAYAAWHLNDIVRVRKAQTALQVESGRGPCSAVGHLQCAAGVDAL